MITEIIYKLDKRGDHLWMDTNSIRRENLRALAARYDTQAEFAAICESFCTTIKTTHSAAVWTAHVSTNFETFAAYWTAQFATLS